jgi:inorganic triphosphatase YgiF
MGLKNNTEREFKFIAKQDSIFRFIERKKTIAGFILDKRKDKIVRDTYFDSDDLDLYLQKAGLRLRKEGNQYCITFKKQINVKKGILTRNEIEEELTSTHYENAIIELKSTHPYELALAFSFQKSIKPIVELINHRTIIYLTKEANTYELCLDTVQYNLATPEVEDYEIGIECIEGDELWMKPIVFALTSEFPINKSKSSKYKRCLESQSKIKK